MKILFVQKMAAISGSELYLMQLLPELKRRGYEVQVLIIFPTEPATTKPFIDHFKRHGIATHEIYGHGALSPALLLKLRRLLKREKFDIVQSNLVHADLWIAIMKLLFFHKLKIVSVKHGYHGGYSAKYGNDPRHLKKTLYYWLQKFSGRFANYNITISKGVYEMYIKGKMVPKDKIRNIYYGLDLSEKEKQVVEREPEEKYALLLGRLEKYKGHELVMRAWKKVLEQNKNWKLYFIGNGTYENELLQLKEKLQLGDEVRFLGYQANPHQFIMDSRFMLVASRWEGFGMIMLESWVHKKAIIAIDAPAMNEVVDHEINGLLVKQDDVDDFAEKVIYLFNNPAIAAAMGEKGKEKLLTYYTLKRMTDETEEVYQNVFNKT